MVQCCNANKHITVSIVGLSLACYEFILASVYNFHTIGFGLSLICIICSSLYLYFTYKDMKTEETNLQVDPTLADTVQPVDEDRLMPPQSAVDILKAQ